MGRRLDHGRQAPGDSRTREAVVRADLAGALPLLIAERDENTCRKDLLPTEAVALGEAIEAIESKAAKQRQAAAGPSMGKGKKRSACGNLPQAVKGKTREKVAAAQARPISRLVAQDAGLLTLEVQ